MKLLYNLILFLQAECYFLIILKGVLKRHMSKELGLAKVRIPLSFLTFSLTYLFRFYGSTFSLSKGGRVVSFSTGFFEVARIVGCWLDILQR